MSDRKQREQVKARPSRPTVLVADDEGKITRLIGSYLEAAGFSCLIANDGAEALDLYERRAPDCLVLDINMPGMDGLDVAREVRRVSLVPIIFLSARADETDRVVGLELGGDDYVTKPFSPRELVARVKAVLRRSAPPANGVGADAPIVRRGELELDARKRSVSVSGRPRSLTAAQFDLLAFLARSPGRVFTRLELLEGCAGNAFEGYERTIDAHVKNLRKALGDDADEPRFIGTVRGIGYRFIEDTDEA